MSVLLTLIIFSIIVVIHEWGHMCVAKACKVYVEEFSVGMGPKLLETEKNGTLYTLRILPLGGFCRMADSSDEETGIVGFNDISVWKRIAICVAGPFMNFVLAVVVMICISMSIQINKCDVVDVIDGQPAQAAGIKAGDRIIAVNGNRVHISNELTYEIYENADAPLEIKIKRGSETLVKTLKAEYNKEEQRYMIGVLMDSKAPFLDIGLYKDLPDDMERATFFESVYDGAINSIFIVKETFVGFAKLIAREIPTSELSGPIGVTTVVGESYNSSKEIGYIVVLLNMARITALLSANLGIMNLLPIPGLDGGKLLIYFVEIIRRKKMSPEKEGMITIAGFALLLTLAVVVAYHDILKLIH